MSALFWRWPSAVAHVRCARADSSTRTHGRGPPRVLWGQWLFAEGRVLKCRKVGWCSAVPVSSAGESTLSLQWALSFASLPSSPSHPPVHTACASGRGGERRVKVTKG